MAERTPLDAVHERMTQSTGGDAERLAFYAALADTPLWVLLESAPEGDSVTPKLVDTDQGAAVPAVDREERPAALARDIAPQAAMPGRVLFRMLAGQGVGLGLNVGVAPTETVLTEDVVTWLAERLDEAPETLLDARPEELGAPEGLPEPLLEALDARLARVGVLAERAYLAEVRYRDGRRVYLLAIVGADAEAERAIAGTVAEAVRFGGDGMPTLDVAFVAPGGGMVARLEKVALRFDLPAPPDPEPHRPAAPGSDPDKPPILRRGQ